MIKKPTASLHPSLVAPELLASFFHDGDQRLSRNRNFDAYLSVTTQRAARVSRYLKGLQEILTNLAARDAVTIEPAPDRDDTDPHQVTLRLTIEDLSCRRTAFLSEHEFTLLCEGFPWLKAKLHAASNEDTI